MCQVREVSKRLYKCEAYGILSYVLIRNHISAPDNLELSHLKYKKQKKILNYIRL